MSYVTNMNTKVNTNYTDIGSIFCDNSYNQTLGGNKTFTGTVFVPTPASDASLNQVVTAKWTKDTITDQFIKNNIFKSWSYINASFTNNRYTLSENGTAIHFDPGMYLIMVKPNKNLVESDYLSFYTLAFVAITNSSDQHDQYSSEPDHIRYIFSGQPDDPGFSYKIVTYFGNQTFPVYSINIIRQDDNSSNIIDIKLYQLII